MSSDISAQTLQHNPGVLAAEVGGNIALMNVQSGYYYALDEIGSEMWRGIESATTVSDLVSMLSHRYDGPVGEITADVEAVIEEWLTYRLIRLGSSDAEMPAGQ